MARFIRRSKEATQDDLLLRSPREEFERFVSNRVHALEKLGQAGEAQRVLDALDLGRARLSPVLGGRPTEAEGKADQ